MRTLLGKLASWAHSTGDGFLEDVWPGVLARSDPGGVLRTALTCGTEASPKPLVLLIDEINSLTGYILLSVLRQLRSATTGTHKAFLERGALRHV